MRENIPMNEYFVVGLILSFVVGGLVGWFVNDRYSGKRYKREIQRLCDENNELANEKSVAIVKREEALNIANTRLDRSFDDLRKDKPTLKDLASKYGTPTSEEVPDDSMEEYMLKRAHPEDDVPIQEPFIIDAETFELEYPDAENVTLSYYTEDKIIADERDEVMKHPYDILGECAMDTLRDTGEDVIYVRNDAHDTIYEINVCHEMSYHNVVLGSSDSEGFAKDDSEDEDE